jgi:hypothetical protein
MLLALGPGNVRVSILNLLMNLKNLNLSCVFLGDTGVIET